MRTSAQVLALSGGVGGAKLSLGLQQVLARGSLTVVVNTGDDFWHLGLRICPDLDTTLYTLAGVAEPAQGWGRAGETFGVLGELERRGFASWFRLGDRDLALHLERTGRLQAGESLSAVTAALAAAFEVDTTILPMTDAPVATRLLTDEGWLGFQDYFVRRRCEPRVLRVEYSGVEAGGVASALETQLACRPVRAIILCPSNPWLSIEPILAVPGMRSRLRALGVPIIAVSPLVAGRAVKGPTAKLMGELGLTVSHASIARQYKDFIDGLVINEGDEALLAERAMSGVKVRVAPTLMQSLADREALAKLVLSFADDLRDHAGLRCKGEL